MEKQWSVEFHEAFLAEFSQFSSAVRIEIAALVESLQRRGPLLGRPQVDTLKGSRFDNMKELRFSAASGVWRVAFAFDPERKAILLVAGDKGGVSQDRFYKSLLRIADERFMDHLVKIKVRQEKL